MSYPLPEAFLTKMQDLLGQEYLPFLQSYDAPKTQGLRVNTGKISPSEFLNLSPFSLRPVPWLPEGFYYDETSRPGRHPYHAAGLYYIQEPSAMAAVSALDPQPGDKVLDLCAAPGGKATHIGARLLGRGILVSNEFVPGRARILAENLERCGITNAVVLNEHPGKLEKSFSQYFDKVLVDAPCSGEGMFRKEPEARAEWSEGSASACAARQLEILRSAVAMLRPGGTLLYSTCTFAPEENEQVIERLLGSCPNLKAVALRQKRFFSPGRPAWGLKADNGFLTETARLWPHLLEGEGHFVALLRDHTSPGPVTSRHSKVVPVPRESAALWDSFAQANLHAFESDGTYLQYAEHLYLSPSGLPSLDGLKVVRPGWHLGLVRKNRFEPSHALALGLKPGQSRCSLNLSSLDPAVLKYLRGESLTLSGAKGWNVLTVDGFPLGWGKHDGNALKNHYPKGLRWF